MTTKNNMLLLLRKIMKDNNLTEVEILEDMQRNVLWYDNGGHPSEDAITKLLWDGTELGFELSTFAGAITVYENDAAFNDIGALHEVLGSVFITVCKMPENIHSDSYDMVEELFVDILERRIAQSNAHSKLMELASDIAAQRLMAKYNLPFEHFVVETEDDPDTTEYLVEYHDEVDEFYQDEYERYAAIFGEGIDKDTGMIIVPITMKELVGRVVSLGERGGGVIEIRGTWRHKPRSIRIEQTEWCETPVCLIGGYGNEVSTLHPRDVPRVLDCILGNYLDGESISIVTD